MKKSLALILSLALLVSFAVPFTLAAGLDRAQVAGSFTVEETAVEEPVVEEPAAEEPAAEEPVAEEPAAEEPAAEEPAAEEPVADDPVAEEPAVDEPVADEPAVEEPAVDEPAVDEPTVEEPVIGNPVAKDVVLEEFAEETALPPVEEDVVEEAAEDGATSISAITMGTKPSNGTVSGVPFSYGVAGSNSFRIPALVNYGGALVAAADVRWNTTYDGGGLDTIVARSYDSGTSWSYTIANYLGDNGNTYNGSSSTAFIDPALVNAGGTIYMLVDLYPYGVALNGSGNTAPSTAVGFNDAGKLLLSGDNHGSYGYYLDGSTIRTSGGTAVEGYTVDEYFNITATDGSTSNLFFSNSPYKVVRTGFLYLTKSTDGGKTWSAPTLLDLKTSSEQVCLVGPGSGLYTSERKIIFPVYSYNGSSGSQRMGFIYSSDGTDWTRVNSSVNWSSEAAVVELTDGTLRFFYRNGTARLCYVDYSFSTGWGSAVTTDIYTNSNTQISAISYSQKVDGKQIILVSCPIGNGSYGSTSSASSARTNGRLFVFADDGSSMTLQNTVTVNNSNFMYSCLAECSDGSVALLYEGASDYAMSFVTFTAQELGLSSGSDSGGSTGSTTLTHEGTGVTVSTESTTGTLITELSVTAGAVASESNRVRKVYDIAVNGGAYTGAATVTIPYDTAFDGCSIFWGEADGDVFPVEKTDAGFLCHVPHFSTVTINGSDGTVVLEVGESAEAVLSAGATLTGAYDAAVVEVGVKDTDAVTHADSKGALGSNAYYNDGDTIPLCKALYTFTSSGSGYVVESKSVDGLYLNTDGNGAGYPNATTAATVTITEGYATNSFYLLAGTKYLHFYRNGNNVFDRVSTTNGFEAACSFYLYRPIADGENSSSVIPGYIQATSVTEGDYLIVAYYNGSYYVLHPSTDTTATTGKYTHVARVTGESTTCTEQEAGTMVTFTGLVPGTTAVTVGGVTFTVTVNAKSAEKSLTIQPNGTAALEALEVLGFDSAGGYTVTYKETVDESNVIGLSGDEVTAGTAEGTATVTATVSKDGVTYGKVTYTITVAPYENIEYIYIPVGGTYSLSGDINIDGLDTSIATVASGVITGVKEGTTSVILETTLYSIYVFAPNTDENSNSKSIKIEIDAIENCTVYYSINGGPLTELTSKGILIDQYITGGFSIIFFAAPNEGYALTSMTSTGSNNQYYTLSDGVLADGTDSTAWPLNDDGTAKTDPIKGEGHNHGLYGCIDFGILSADDLKNLYTKALTFDCDGVQTFTRKSNDSGLNTNLTFVAEKLPTLEKSILSVSRDGVNIGYTEGTKLEFGDVITYQFTVTSESTNVNYTDITLVDETIGHSQPIADNTFDTAGTYTYTATYALTAADIAKYTGGEFHNTAALNYTYSSAYSSGTYGGTAEGSVSCDIVGVVSYVWEEGTPEAIVNNEDGHFNLPASLSITVGQEFYIQKYSGETEYTDADGVKWVYTGEWGVVDQNGEMQWFNVTEEVLSAQYTMNQSRSITFYGRWQEETKYTVSYQWDGETPAGVEVPAGGSYYEGDTYTVDNSFTTIDDGEYIWTFQGWKISDDDTKYDGTPQTMGTANVIYTGTWTKTAKTTSLTIYKSGDAVQNNEGFIFLVEDLTDSTSFTVSVGGTGSVTIAGLMVGHEYKITEKTNWSWRYNASYSAPSQTITLKESNNLVTVTNELNNKIYLLDGSDYKANNSSEAN